MPINKKLLFVFAGLPGSGKDTCLDYLKNKYSASIFSFTDILQEALNAFYLEFNRDNLIRMSECIREKFGEDTLARAMADKVKNTGGKISAIGNARRLADVKYLSQLEGYVLIKIEADIHTRYNRIKIRGQKSSDSTQTFEQFKADHQRSTEISILDIVKQATEGINNDGDLNMLYEQLEKIIKKYLHD